MTSHYTCRGGVEGGGLSKRRCFRRRFIKAKQTGRRAESCNTKFSALQSSLEEIYVASY